jgi:hypothetical protein
MDPKKEAVENGVKICPREKLSSGRGKKIMESIVYRWTKNNWRRIRRRISRKERDSRAKKYEDAMKHR